MSRRVLQAILNHKDRSVTAVYDRYAMNPEKEEAHARLGVARRGDHLRGHTGGGGSLPVPTPAGERW